MKEHIKELAKEYAQEDFTAGINRVLQHPEEFGLQTKEY